MIVVSNLMFLLFMGTVGHTFVASLYALHHINGESATRAKRNGILAVISIIILFYYRQSAIDLVASIPVYGALSIAFLYLGYDAIRDGKRYPKMQKEEAKQ